MAFENALLELRVPDTAAPGSPGIEITRTIPAPLLARYTAPDEQLVAVTLYYSDSTTLYWYDGIATTKRLIGHVRNGVAQETTRLFYNGAQMMPWDGYEAGQIAVRQFGPSDGVYIGTHQFNISGAKLNGSVGSPLEWRGPIDFVNARPIEVYENSTFSGISSTSGVTGSPICGTSFVAPQSGSVWISVGGFIWSGSNTQFTALGWKLSSGGTLNTGTIVKSADYTRALISSRAVNTGAEASIGATKRTKWDGLTPGNTYNVVTQHWVSGGTGGTVDHRILSVEPIL